MDDDRRTWDDRYGDQLPGPPTPPIGVAEVRDQVPAGGRALDVACGLGATALWAATRGFDVVALDVSPVAIAAARSLADRLGLAERTEFRVHDLDDGLPADLTGPFDLVTCQRYRQPALVPALLDRLAPGGLVALTVLSSVGASRRPGPFHAAPGELERAVTGLELLYAIEGGGEATVVARRPRPG